MGVLINKDAQVLVQGFIGKGGTFHSRQARLTALKLSAALLGQRRSNPPEPACIQHHEEAVKEASADSSVIYVPAPVCVGFYR